MSTSSSASSNNRERFWPSKSYGNRLPRADYQEFEEVSLPSISTIHEYENQSKHPRIHRNFIDLPKNKVTPFTLRENDQYYQPADKPIAQSTTVRSNTNHSKAVQNVRPLNKSEVLKIVLITIGCFLGLCIVSAAIAVPLILKTSSASSTTSTTSIKYDVPTGTILLYTGNSLSLPEPADRWLLCNGSAVSRVTYSDLFAVIGITFGLGNAINTFNLPDFRSRFPMGSNGNTLSAGGNSALTLNQSQLPAHTHDEGSLTTNTIPAHTHGVTDPGHDHGGATGGSGSQLSFIGSGNVLYSGGGSFTIASHTHTISTDITGISLQTAGSHAHTINGTTASVGLGQPINIIPPYQTVHYIIRA